MTISVCNMWLVNYLIVGSLRGANHGECVEKLIRRVSHMRVFELSAYPKANLSRST